MASSAFLYSGEIHPSGNPDLFYSSEPIPITLRGPFSEIDRERDKSKEYAGALEYTNFEGDRVSLDVKLSARGNWRLRTNQCRHAQLWINLKKNQVADTLFAGQDKLKMVVQCSIGSNSEQWLLKEELAYKIFNEFSDLGLRTQLLQVNFEDPDNPRKQRSQYAFLIEHHKSVATINGMETESEPSIKMRSLDAHQTTLVALFANLIGHTDFSFFEGAPDDKCCHNMKILFNEEGVRFPIPYDFDNTGWVSADYAAGPSPNIPIKTTKERIYRGLCIHKEHVAPLITGIEQKEAAIRRLVSHQPGLSYRNKKRLSRYTEEWFASLQDPTTVRADLVSSCRY
ncbi:MAG: hypothetical protein MI746_07710 [Pseudomonadales bacterium]|nr:hypothetical protein [Pseudomonadales bacterium]